MYFNNAWSTLWNLTQGSPDGPLDANWNVDAFIGEPSEYTYNVYRDNVIITTTGEESYTDESFDATTEHTWSVKIACEGGGESAAIIAKKEACNPPPPPCNPVTGATANIVEECTTATISWAVVTNAKEYKISRDGVATATVAAPPYTETAEFEDGKTYTWKIKTVCAENESTEVSISAKADCVGINELVNNVAIFPNPTTGKITIQVDNFLKVEIFNTVGQLVETKTVDTFDISDYNTGIYFFKVYNVNNNSVTKRVMVAK
jgi:hypothetical protein